MKSHRDGCGLVDDDHVVVHVDDPDLLRRHRNLVPANNKTDIDFIYSAADVKSVICPQVLISDEPVVVAKDPFKMAYKS